MSFEILIDGKDVSDHAADIYNALFDAGRISLSADTIAYTEDFERLYERLHLMYPVTRNEAFCWLMNCRKSKKLRRQED